MIRLALNRYQARCGSRQKTGIASTLYRKMKDLTSERQRGNVLPKEEFPAGAK
jgi:hypothetical protein